MSNVTRGGMAAVLAAVRGKTASRMEDEKPEDDNNPPAEEIEDDQAPDEEAEGDPIEEAAEAEGEDDENMTATQARHAERKRIHGILTHPKADANPGLAAELAFSKRGYSVAEAGSLLAAGGAVSAGSTLATRMAGKSPKLGAGASTLASEKASMLANIGKHMKARHPRNMKG